MLSTELAATAEALYDRALVRGETLMQCRACDVLAIIDAARTPPTVGYSSASEHALKAKVAELEARAAADLAAKQAHAEELRKAQDELAAAEAKVDEADRLLAANGQAGLELATALAEKGRFEALALEAATQNEALAKQLAEAQAAAKALEIAQASASSLSAELEATKAADAAKAEAIAKLETTVAGLKAAIAAST